MNEQRIFADVDLPFHVWVREGRRWVLRDAASHLARHERDAAASSAPERTATPGKGRTPRP